MRPVSDEVSDEVSSGEAATPAPEPGSPERKAEFALAFREALARWASGVTVVTARDPSAAPGSPEAEVLQGLTASSFTSVSIDPPLVLVCVAQTSQTLPVVRRAGSFTVSLLAESQERTSDYFADRPGARTPPAFDALGGVSGALAVLACDLWEDYAGGDHRILVGRVKQIALGAPPREAPLLYWQRRYRGLRSDPQG